MHMFVFRDSQSLKPAFFGFPGYELSQELFKVFDFPAYAGLPRVMGEQGFCPFFSWGFALGFWDNGKNLPFLGGFVEFNIADAAA